MAQEEQEKKKKAEEEKYRELYYQKLRREQNQQVRFRKEQFKTKILENDIGKFVNELEKRKQKVNKKVKEIPNYDWEKVKKQFDKQMELDPHTLHRAEEARKIQKSEGIKIDMVEDKPIDEQKIQFDQQKIS